MSTTPPAAALPLLDGWFTPGDPPRLVGTRCAGCGTYYFPRLETSCRNPGCTDSRLERTELSGTGRLWSFTNACYQPPAPYVAAEPFVPFAIAAVELEQEKMIVLGQVIAGVDVDQLRIGMQMELVVEPVLAENEPAGRLVWKWRPATMDAS